MIASDSCCWPTGVEADVAFVFAVVAHLHPGLMCGVFWDAFLLTTLVMNDYMSCYILPGHSSLV